jgi:hypothetical protein
MLTYINYVLMYEVHSLAALITVVASRHLCLDAIDGVC